MNSDVPPRADGRGDKTRQSSPGRPPLSVLYVDGDESRRHNAKQLEWDDQLDVSPVATAEVALDHLPGADCIVSRYELPETDGLQLLTTVRDQYRDLPFLLVTDNGSEQLASEATAAGVTDYVPVTEDDNWDRLVQRIEDTMETSRRRIATSQFGGIEKAVENAADAILVTDTEGTIEYVNPAFESVTGFSREEAIGRNPRIIKSGVQNESYYEEMWDAVLAGETWEAEITNETKSGDRYVAHQTIAPVTDEDGAVEKFVGVQRDVTRRRRLEEQIERSATVLEQLYEVATDETTDLRGKIDAALEIGAEYLDYPVGYFTHIDDGTQHVVVAVGDHEKIHEGATDPLERTYCRKTIASDEPVLVSDAPNEGWEDDPAYDHFGLQCYVGAKVVVDGEVYGTLCFGGPEPTERFILDVQQSTVKTLAQWVGYEIERHRYEQRLERQNERLEKFASVVSHDLRNPLNVAQARLEMGQETGKEEHFEVAAESHERMAEIIESTLTLARGGSFVDETETVSLQTIASDCWTSVETDDATLSVAGDATLEADPDKLRHVFENLFRNAIEHGSTSGRPSTDATAEHGETAVTVEVGPIDNGFYIADDGPGIEPAQREDIFDHGYSGSDGTGFGLAIVDAVVQAHGWSIRVTESEAGGARFECRTEGIADEDTVLPD